MIFWSASCWCSSKIEKSGGGWKSWKVRLWAHLSLCYFLRDINMMYLKWSHFHLKLIIQEKVFFLTLKKLNNIRSKSATSSCWWKWSLNLEIFPKSSTDFRQRLEWSNFENFNIFPHIIFQKILNLPEKVGKDQFWNSLHRI